MKQLYKRLVLSIIDMCAVKIYLIKIAFILCVAIEHILICSGIYMVIRLTRLLA
jgi:hypothetical protein